MTARIQISHNLSDFPFHYELQTRWKDMDAFGHVNNAVFLSYIEDSRITFFKRWNLRDKKKSIIVASVKLDYLRQIDHPSNIIIGETISRIGKKSFDIKSAIFINENADLVATSKITCVCFNYEKNKSVPVYSEIIKDYTISKID